MFLRLFDLTNKEVDFFVRIRARLIQPTNFIDIYMDILVFLLNIHV